MPWLVRDARTRWIHLFVGGACTLLLYQFTNRVHFFPPKLLEFGPVDSRMPFWPWSVWVYFTEYAFFVYAYFWLRSYELVTRYYYSYMTILGVSVVCFAIFPVTFPRANFPIVGDSFSDQAMIFLRNFMDQPANCLPSLHVSSCFISSLCFWKESKIRSSLLIFWSCMVAISTMTTKQHYFVDVWTAAVLTALVYWVFFLKVGLAGEVGSQGLGRRKERRDVVPGRRRDDQESQAATPQSGSPS